MGDGARQPSSMTTIGALVGCGEPTTRSSPPAPISTTPAAYDGAAYAQRVQAAVLDSFGLTGFTQACPQPDWVCTIKRIDSLSPGGLTVTLDPGWDQVEWTGPPAGIGCAKWGERISRNITTFADASGVTPSPRKVEVYQVDGSRC